MYADDDDFRLTDYSGIDFKRGSFWMWKLEGYSLSEPCPDFS